MTSTSSAMKSTSGCASILRAACAAALLGTAGGVPALGTAAGATDAPKSVIQMALNEVLDVLRSDGIPQEERRQKIEKIAYSRFDFDRMSRLVLAKNWPKLSDQQRTEFESEFRKHLSLTYGRRLNSYHDESIEVVSARTAGSRDVTVQTRVVGGAAGPDGVKIDYRLRERDGNWLVIDVIVEGVSLIQNFRSQVQDIISAKGVDSLIQILQEKNAKDATSEAA
jgi:phospholipid transport system substrate-binding protein